MLVKWVKWRQEILYLNDQPLDIRTSVAYIYVNGEKLANYPRFIHEAPGVRVWFKRTEHSRVYLAIEAPKSVSITTRRRK